MSTHISKHLWLKTSVSCIGVLLTLLVTALPVRAQSVATLTTTCLNKFYAIPLETNSWQGARDAALALGGHLAIIDSPAENECLANWVASQSSAIKSVSSALSSGGGVHYVWLGATDDFSEGTWKWVDGQLISGTSYKNWGSGPLGTEPDNLGNQDYLAMAVDAWPKGPAPGQGIGRAGQWNDITGTALNTYMVEFEAKAAGSLPSVGGTYSMPVYNSRNVGQRSYIRIYNPSTVSVT